MCCRLKSQHAFPCTLLSCVLKVSTIVAEEGFGGLNLCSLFLYATNLLARSIFLPQHMNPIPFPDMAHVWCFGTVLPPPSPPPSGSGQSHPHSNSKGFWLPETLGHTCVPTQERSHMGLCSSQGGGRKDGSAVFHLSSFLPSLLSKLHEEPGHF